MNLFAKFESPVELTTAAAIIGAAEKIVKKSFEAEKAKCTISTVYEDVAKGEVAVSKPVEIWATMEAPDDAPLKPDGKTKYKTVVINGKKWLAENYINIPTKGETFTPVYNGTEYPEYGLIYDVDALLAVKETLVGTGWHIPSIEEWEAVMKYAYENYKDGVNTEETTPKELSTDESTYKESGGTIEFYKLSANSTEGKPCPAVAALVGECTYNTTKKCSTANLAGLGLLPCGRNSGTVCEATQQGCYWNSYNLENITGNADKKQTSYHYFQLNNGHYMYGREGKGYYCAIRLVHD